MEIKKEDLIKAWNNHLPKKWIRFAFKYFSKSTVKENMPTSNTIVIILLVLFGTGMLGTILHWSRAVIGTVTIAYGIILSILVLFLLAAVLSNNRRIKKIAKELGCTLDEFNKAADVWGDELK